MHTAGRTDLELLARQRIADTARLARRASVQPPPRRRALRRNAARGLRNLADFLN